MEIFKDVQIDDNLLEKAAKSDGVIKVMNPREDCDFQLQFKEIVIFTKWGKVYISGSDLNNRGSSLCHGFSQWKLIDKDFKKNYLPSICREYKPSTVASRKVYVELFGDYVKNGNYYSLSHAFKTKAGKIQSTGYLSLDEDVVFRNFPNQERICLIKRTYKENVLFYSVLKTFRKLPDYWIDWEKLIKEIEA